MMTGNFACENTINEFCRFLRVVGVIVTLVLNESFFYINICCFIITVLSDRGKV